MPGPLHLIAIRNEVTTSNFHLVLGLGRVDILAILHTIHGSITRFVLCSIGVGGDCVGVVCLEEFGREVCMRFPFVDGLLAKFSREQEDGRGVWSTSGEFVLAPVPFHLVGWGRMYEVKGRPK